MVGLGYVGLPLALQFPRAGATVVALDIDENKVKQLNGGASYIKHVAASAMTQKECCRASGDFSNFRERK
jgi:UDP-N-acetyl-D-glucosamine dehydrogenase